ncbi:MAG: hypothetical protein WCF07_08235 [Nitrososphaeraceae archaeon]
MSANACPTLPLHKSRLELKRHLEILQTVLPDLRESNVLPRHNPGTGRLIFESSSQSVTRQPYYSIARLLPREILVQHLMPIETIVPSETPVKGYYP